MLSRKKAKDSLIAYLFLAPALVAFLVFLLFPFVSSIILSFTQWNMVSGLSGIKWIGFQNFCALLRSARIGKALANNLVFTVTTVPLALIFSLLIAYVLNEKVYLKRTIRLFYFVPYICNIIAVSAVWRCVFRSPNGPVNQFLAALGIENLPRWFADGSIAIIPLIILTIWTSIGYDMIIYMAALQGVPRELYEAGEMDGAVGVKRFYYITMPSLSPTTYFLIVTRLIHSFQIFSAIKVITQGGPGSSTTVLVYEIYIEAFTNYKFGYASAIAFLLFVIIMAITLVQQSLQKKWVTYS